MTRVELFEAIRRDKIVGGKSVRAIAQERRVHRRIVRQALADAVPPKRREAARRAPVLIESLRHQVDGWLREDVDAPRKQRHTSRRVFQRLRGEFAFTGAESTVRNFVARRRRAMGMKIAAFVPLTHAPGEEAEVDWYVADVRFPWGTETAQIFQMRACFSGREFHRAFPRQTQQAFLEGHVAALAHFGGVFARIRYDNLTSAVTKVLRGRRRQEADRFVVLHSHYLFAAEFCLPGLQGAHEKGGVEGGVGRFRRQHLVPVPEASGYPSLNRYLLDCCALDDARRRVGHDASIAEGFREELPKLRPLPTQPLGTAEISRVRVNAKSCVQVRRRFYSVPVCLVGRQVEARVHAAHVEIIADGKAVAHHARLQGAELWRVDLDHYLELLRLKPQALRQALPLRQARERGEWPAAHDRLWAEMRRRHGESEGTRQLVDVLLLHRDHPSEEVLMAVELALSYGSADAGAVEMLLRHLQTPQPKIQPFADLGHLARYERPVLAVTDYNQLLGPAASPQVWH